MLQGAFNVQVFMDDFLMYGYKMEKHENHLDKLLQPIKSACLKLKKEKYFLRQNYTWPLGHLIDQLGVRPDVIRPYSSFHQLEMRSNWKSPRHGEPPGEVYPLPLHNQKHMGPRATYSTQPLMTSPVVPIKMPLDPLQSTDASPLWNGRSIASAAG